MDTETTQSPARFSKKLALQVLDARAARIAGTERFNRSHGTAQLRGVKDLDELVRRAVEYGRMRAYEGFAEAIEEGFRFEGAAERPVDHSRPPVRDVLVHFNTVTLTFDDNAAAHAFAGPHGVEAVAGMLDGGPIPQLAHPDAALTSGSPAPRARTAGMSHSAQTSPADSDAKPFAWVSISHAPMDGSVILCDDTTGSSQWAVAKWVAGDEWSGWIYDDDIMNDSAPLGPQPTMYLAGLASHDEALQADPLELVRNDIRDAARWNVLEAAVDSSGVIVAIPDSGGDRWNGQGLSNAGDLQDWADEQLVKEST